ncbi:MCE family protein [Williamsia sp.]|uniref:MCE family protein n=1 Tax=Williamsia sp. TaxID=1872085 RepID=UPI002F920395
MLKYRGGRLARHGFIGVVLICLLVTVGLQGQKYITWFTSLPYQAVFEEAAGLRSGADVVLSGVKVGKVSEVSLDNGDVRVEFWVDDGVRLGTQSTAQIKTGSLLGRRMLTVESAGGGVLDPSDTIPRSRTSSPYSLNNALGDLTTNVNTIDTGALNQSLDTLSSTIDLIAPQLGPTFDGLSELSRSINGRNESLRDLLSSTNDVTSILSERSEQLNSLLLNANSLLGVLVNRRQEIVDLLANTSAVAQQLAGVVADNESQLAPTLDRLNSVAALLEKNRDNIAQALPGLAKVALTQGEAVSSGPFYNAFVANLIPGHLIQPFINQSFGIEPGVPFPIPGGQIPVGASTGPGR